jgi:hypothetical protein
MANVNKYCINLGYDSAQIPEKQWTATIFYTPSTVASGPQVPGVQTGPLGATGTAAATYTHGDGTTALGYDNPGDALERAKLYISTDHSLGN